MGDRELLELAAKANWRQELADDEVSLRYSESDDGMLYLHADNQDHNGQDREFVWNPLTQNHDALGLAVKLDIDIFFQSDELGRFTSAEGSSFAYEHHNADPYEATRRAIVRAAAEIGRNKEQGDGGGV